MNHIRRIIWALVFVLVLGLLPGTARASEPELPESFGPRQLTTRVNPLYQDVLEPEDLGLDNRPSRPREDAQTQAVTYSTVAQAAVQMRRQMTNRATSFTLYITAATSDYEEVLDQVLLQALDHTGSPKEGDYLMWHYAGIGGSVERTPVSGQYRYTFYLELAYYTTAAQEAQMDSAVSNLLRSLNLSGKSSYQKVKAVYDYICSNVTYDYAHLEDESYTLQFTAYAALVNKTAVCQGYASLFYRLMLELGIDARVIAGDGGGPHGWNIVRLGDVYYNVDATWDAGMDPYQCFLRETETFTGHARYLEYMTTQFHTDYPMAEEDYVDGVAGVPEFYYVYGTCGENAYWAVSRDRQLTILGEGVTNNVAGSGPPFVYWTDGFDNVVIDEGITVIGQYLFSELDNIRSVQFPNSLKTLSMCAFDGCSNLKEIVFGRGLETIGPYCFQYCGLESVTIPDSVTNIDSFAFSNSPLLTEAILHGGVTNPGHGAFADCPSLTKVILPDGITLLGPGIFENCTALTEITLPSTLGTIGYNAFRGSGIRNIVIPDSVTQMGMNAFSECPQLSSVVFGSGLTNIGNSAFTKCRALTSVVMSDSITTVGDQAFSMCTSLSQVRLSNSLQTIGVGAFSNTNLTDIVFPQGLQTIDSDAFRACGFTEVTIPSSVTTLSGFYNCSKLERVIWEDPGLEIIGGYAFYGCRALEEFEIPASVTSVYASAFQECSGLKTMVIPESVTELQAAFAGCTALETVTLNHSGRIPGYCFSGCTALKNVVIGEAVTKIEVCAFAGCTALEILDIPAGVRELGSQVFQNCSRLDQIHFGGEAPAFASDSFSGVTATAYYPGELHSWTDEVLQDYSGNITWVSTHIHTYESVVTPPTCTEQGYTTYTCTECGRVKTADYVSALGHRPGPWEVIREPSCITSGAEQAVCQVCGHTETRPLLPLGHDFREGFCSRCGREQPRLQGLVRIAGEDRIATSLLLADQLREILGIGQFNTVIVASARNFPDALTGSYLAAVNQAPILLTYDAAHGKVTAYIEANLAPGGTVYVLGGESAVSAGFVTGLQERGIRTERVSGSDRFGTNLAIMEQAGVSADQPVLIATAVNFADSLSASAAGLPMVLVHGSLLPQQRSFLESTSRHFIIIGGTAAVSEALEAELAAIGTVERLAGEGRYETSVLVAQRFLPEPSAAVLAYARNFPDGLCGGPLAYALGAPLILTDDLAPGAADQYVQGLSDGIVAGGESLISSETAADIFDLN